MNIQAIKDELSQFIQTEFHEDDWNILSELADIFVSQHGAVVSRDEQNTEPLTLDSLMEFVQMRADNRSRTAKLIREYLRDDSIIYCPGNNNQKTQIVFKTFDSFINACFCLRSPKAKLVSRFAAKCTSLVVELVVALKINLEKTEKELKKEKAEVFRRVYLVIKDSVAEARREMGRRCTDFKWRQTHYCTIVSRLLGSVYVKGKTPYVRTEYMQTAKQSIKKYYKDCKLRDTQKQKDTRIQTTIDNVQAVPNGYNKTSTSRCPMYVN